MPQYKYTGDVDRLLTGLVQGVNADHLPADGAPSDLPDGSTVVVSPGDSVQADEPYEAACLTEVTAPAAPATPAATDTPIADSTPVPAV